MNEWQFNQKEETEINLARIGRALLKKAWLILIVALIFGVVSYVYTAYFVTPVYRSGFTAYVNSQMSTDESGNVSVSNLNASIGLAYAYSEIITSRSVLMDAAQECGYDIPYDTMRGKVSIAISDSTAIITVYVQDTDPVRATKLASAIAEMAPYHVERVVDGGSMRVLDEPVQPGGKFAPSNAKNTILGAMIGLLLTAVLIAVVETINDKVQDAQELESRYQIAIVGNIPDMSKKNHEGYGKAGKR